MCLGDMRLQRFVTNNFVTITTTTAYAKYLERNPLRVGILIPANANDSFIWFGGTQPAATIGIIIDSATFSNGYWSYRDFGPLVEEELWIRTATAGVTMVILEQLVPADVKNQLERMGLK